VKVAPPVYFAAIVLRHQEWEAHVRKKQKNTKTALDAKLKQLRSAAMVDRDVVAIADTENLIDDIEYQQGQEVPYNLTDSERLVHSNESRSHSHSRHVGETSWKHVCPHLRAVHTNPAG